MPSNHPAPPARAGLLRQPQTPILGSWVNAAGSTSKQRSVQFPARPPDDKEGVRGRRAPDQTRGGKGGVFPPQNEGIRSNSPHNPLGYCLPSPPVSGGIEGGLVTVSSLSSTVTTDTAQRRVLTLPGGQLKWLSVHASPTGHLRGVSPAMQCACIQRMLLVGCLSVVAPACNNNFHAVLPPSQGLQDGGRDHHLQCHKITDRTFHCYPVSTMHRMQTDEVPRVANPSGSRVKVPR